MDQELIDVLIIGAGPAGLTAGLYGARANLKAVLIEKLLPGGELLNTDLIEDYPGFVSVTGRELAEKMEEHALKFGLKIEQGTVTKISRSAETGLFTTNTDEGPDFVSKTVIMTAGGVPKKLEVPGELEYAGRGVSYCAVCDGPLFRNKTVAVVGGGDSAFQESLYLTRHASKVYLVHRRNEFRAQSILQDKVNDNEKIEIVTPTVIDSILGNQTVESAKMVTAGTTTEVPLDGVFIFIGFSPNSGLYDGHLEHDDQGFLITNERMETGVPGLYAAGDVRSQLARQITTAVGDATTAAIAAEQWIEDQAFKAQSVKV